MIFDQYSRYKACSDLLRQGDFTTGDTILDIGSGPECLFGRFMDDAAVTYVDPLIQENSGPGRIKGDVFTSELDGKSFDCVSAVDVFEHIPPDRRQSFLERLSSLGEKTLIIGFPNSDSLAAQKSDKAIEDMYREIYRRDYSWLEEHHRFGLPSLAETVEQLNRLGWHCQTVGHGHAPWLQELLGFVICALDAPAMGNIIMDISGKFNRELYPYDFQSPCYRQFVIASRSPLPPIKAPSGAKDRDEVERAFRALINDAYHQYFMVSMKRFANPEDVFAQHALAVAERDEAMAGRDAAYAWLDGVLMQWERDLLELNTIKSSRIWRFYHLVDVAWQTIINRKLSDHSYARLREVTPVPIRNALNFARAKWIVAQWLVKSSDYRYARLREVTPAPIRNALDFARAKWDVAKWIIKNGEFKSYTAMSLKRGSRYLYHMAPLPIRRAFKWAYVRLTGDPSEAIKGRILSREIFQPPALQPKAQMEGLPDYIVWGVIDWHFRTQRPQHIARELAAFGRRVFYVSALLIDQAQPGFEVEPLDADGRLFQLKLYCEGSPLIYCCSPGSKTVGQLRASIGEAIQWANSRSLVSFVQHPFWHDIAMVLPNSRTVYDCMDHHEGFSNTAPDILTLERSLFRGADLTITTSEHLDQIVAGQAKHRALIRNAGEFEHFANRPGSVYRDPRGRKVIGYYGAIAEWFDQDLLEAIASHFPDCEVLLVGADTVNAKSRLGQSPNVSFTGEVPYAELPFYLHGFDVCILPFKVIPLTLATNPVKVYEYLSAGKPVVTVDLPEMTQFGDLVHAADGSDDFISAVAAALKEPGGQKSIGKRQRFAKEQTWSHRVETLVSHVEHMADEPKISVIVVTYNNLDLTRKCLASLQENSDYPRLEIIVVDNASSDGSRKFLSGWAAAMPDRRLILNEDNKGFAVANNQGLAIASGEYLVLLNNDTYVTPGWARTLSNHLRRDKSIGLIGPVTNNIGNEAKINIAYDSMGEMLKSSANYTRRHIGQTLPLRTVAFFCVMMRRDVYERVGQLDEAFGRGFFEDDDYCRRVERLGLRIVCAEDVFVHHNLSASFDKLPNKERQALFEQNKVVYENKWGKWIPHAGRKDFRPPPAVFDGYKHVPGWCNVCGNETRFFYNDIALWRESLTCEHCLTTSRYRSITRGILMAINDLSGGKPQSLAALKHMSGRDKLRAYDTQPPFYFAPCSYPLPDLLKASGWIDVELSQFKPSRPLGETITPGITNQNLEKLTFADSSFDIVITSDVMEHVRLDEQAHREINRVLRPGGVYIFTVPHSRERDKSLIRVQVTAPHDPVKDVLLMEPEYHGDANSVDGGGALSYRVYGRDLDESLARLGFDVVYSRENIPINGIMDTELYYCRKVVS